MGHARPRIHTRNTGSGLRLLANCRPAPRRHENLLRVTASAYVALPVVWIVVLVLSALAKARQVEETH